MDGWMDGWMDVLVNDINTVDSTDYRDHYVQYILC